MSDHLVKFVQERFAKLQPATRERAEKIAQLIMDERAASHARGIADRCEGWLCPEEVAQEIRAEAIRQKEQPK